jgi:phage FluMu protein Com
MADKPKRLVRIAGLGICEYCGVLLSVEGMAAEAIDVRWRCPNCKKILTFRSFGYKKTGKIFKRIKWVGPKGKWVKQKPQQDFELGNWSVITTEKIPRFSWQ